MEGLFPESCRQFVLGYGALTPTYGLRDSHSGSSLRRGWGMGTDEGKFASVGQALKGTIWLGQTVEWEVMWG